MNLTAALWALFWPAGEPQTMPTEDDADGNRSTESASR